MLDYSMNHTHAWQSFTLSRVLLTYAFFEGTDLFEVVLPLASLR